MTVSELKTEVFSIMQAFNRHIPAEEQLRRCGRSPQPEWKRAAAKTNERCIC
ncbi:VasL domain-containing protein [Escherichia coli]